MDKQVGSDDRCTLPQKSPLIKTVKSYIVGSLLDLFEISIFLVPQFDPESGPAPVLLLWTVSWDGLPHPRKKRR